MTRHPCVAYTRVHIIDGTQPVTIELALRFGRALGQSPQYWLNLQATYDLVMVERTIRHQLLAITPLVPATSA